MNKPDIPQDIARQLDRLIKPIEIAITHIHNLQNHRSESLIKQVRFRQVIFKFRRPCKNQPRDIRFAIRNKQIGHLLGYATDIVVSFFVAETGETERGLTSSTVFFGEIDGKFVNYFTGVSCESTKETAVAVHDDETKTGVVFEEGVEGFCVEFVVAEVEGCVDGFEGFEINVEFSLFTFVCDDVS